MLPVAARLKAKCSMNDLISRSALLEELSKGTIITDDLYGMGIMAGNDHAMKKIKAAPAVDAVEVVRCKDCKHSYEGSPHGLMCECPVGGQNTSLLGGDDFCSNGERRADT